MNKRNPIFIVRVPVSHDNPDILNNIVESFHNLKDDYFVFVLLDNVENIEFELHAVEKVSDIELERLNELNEKLLNTISTLNKQSNEQRKSKD